jgi:hypothetical protein
MVSIAFSTLIVIFEIVYLRRWVGENERKSKKTHCLKGEMVGDFFSPSFLRLQERAGEGGKQQRIFELQERVTLRMKKGPRG